MHVPKILCNFAAEKEIPQKSNSMKKFFLFLSALLVAGGMFAANCTPVDVTYLTSGLSPMTTDDSQLWSWHNNYSCGYGTAYNKNLETGRKGHLFTPALDFTGAETVSVSFQHSHKFGGNDNVQTDYTLWVTSNYKGSFAASTWTQLTIPQYGTNSNWTYVTASIDVPLSCVGANTVFALQYNNGSPTGTWQVKNLHIVSTCAGGVIASPVPVPEVGDARLKVFAQNLRNYYYNLNTGRGNYTQAEFVEKTRKIVNAMMMVDADIFALCEVEAQEIVLQQLADSMNARVEGNPYAAVLDGINEAWDASNDNNIKSGFIYRTDKVRPYGNNNAAAPGAYYYRNTLRIQAFEELETRERFTLSMNHFKAKDNTDDAGNAKRVINANQVLNGLNSYASDPDILIVGDLNCQVGEEPITILLDAGYEEQLLKYDADAYSHCYNGGELIDHALANASMAAQITGAGVVHISTSCGADASKNYNYRYSDHDPYVIGINLTVREQPTECEDIDVTYLTSEMGDMTASGDAQWKWDSQYNCAKVSKQGGYTGYMFTPELNLANKQSVSMSFQHAHKYAGTPSNELTLWVTKDYQGSFDASEWQQLTIDPYTANTSFAFSSVTIDVPLEYVGANTVFAFKYMSTSANYATWEIKNLHLTAVCESGQGLGDITGSASDSRASKVLEGGQLYLLMPDGKRYNVLGIRVK